MFSFVIFCFVAVATHVYADPFNDVRKFEQSFMNIKNSLQQKVTSTLQEEKNGIKTYLDKTTEYSSYLCVINVALSYTNTYSKPLLNSWLEYETQKIEVVRNKIASANFNNQGPNDLLAREASQAVFELEADFKTWTATLSGVRKEAVNKMQKCVT